MNWSVINSWRYRTSPQLAYFSTDTCTGKHDSFSRNGSSPSHLPNKNRYFALRYCGTSLEQLHYFVGRVDICRIPQGSRWCRSCISHVQVLIDWELMEWNRSRWHEERYFDMWDNSCEVKNANYSLSSAQRVEGFKSWVTASHWRELSTIRPSAPDMKPFQLLYDDESIFHINHRR